MAGFSKAIEVARSTEQAGDMGGLYVAGIDREWGVAGRPNGGYLIALMANAGLAQLAFIGSDHNDLLASSAHYLRAPSNGPAEIQVAVLRQGRSASQLSVGLLQGGELLVSGLLHVGTLPGAGEQWWASVDTLDLPPIEECFPLPKEPPGGDFTVDIMEVVEERVDPGVLGFAVNKPTMAGELCGSLTFRDDRPLDCLALQFAVDSYPPASFDLGKLGWAPTFQLSTYIRAIPEPGPLRIRQRARLATGGTLDEVCDVWDCAGNLVAQATQLAGMRV